jgi:polar amino acid transport system substrate-binding protein
MRHIALLISIALAACLLPSMVTAEQLASNQSGHMPLIANESARAELVSFVEEARNFTLANGRDEALKAFNDPNGKFMRGDMYIFAYGFNGTLLAHPYLNNLVGRNNLDMVDLNGVPVIANNVLVAKSGQGFILAINSNPKIGNLSQLKLLYLAKVDDSFYIGSGIYLPGEVPLFSFADQRRLRGFVDEAKDYALKNGRDEALKAFNDPKGQFVRGDLYVFAYDFLGKTLSLPFQPELVGQYLTNSTDPNGIAYRRNGLTLARTGSGEHYYIYPNPADDMRPDLKLSYVAKVDDDWYLGAGIYSNFSKVQNISAMKPESREELKTFVEEAKTRALVTSKDQAIKEFMDLNGTWVRGDIYVFAHDFNGTALCLPYQPEAVGTNRMDIQNDQGIYINREMRAIAGNGSGFYEYEWRNPISNQSQSKLSYVTRVDDTWYLGAGIYEA